MMENENYENIEIESTTEDSETTYSERRPRSRERGPDKKPRTYKAASMSNLTQFNQRPEEFAHYLKEEKGVDITGNSGFGKALLILGIVLGAIFGGAWLYKHYKNKKEPSVESRY